MGGVVQGPPRAESPPSLSCSDESGSSRSLSAGTVLGLCGLADITVAAGPLKRERKTAVSKVHKGEVRVADPRSGAFF